MISWPLLMTRDVLPWTLQTALSDTLGASQQGVSFEPRAAMTPPGVLCVLSSSSGNGHLPVYSSDELGPNLSTVPFKYVMIWVQAHLVFSKALVLGQVRVPEVFGIWDYEGKLGSCGWSRAQSLRILMAWLSAPPAKMLRCLAQSVFEAVLLKLGSEHFGNTNQVASDILPGLTWEVPSSPLEEKVTTQGDAATQTDNAEVDLAAWSPPQETEEQAKRATVAEW